MRPHRGTLSRVLVLMLALCGLGQAAAAGTVTLRALLAVGEVLEPYPLDVDLGGETLSLGAAGALTVERGAGTYRLSATVPGAEVEGPDALVLTDGENAQVTYVVRPVVELELAAVGETAADGRVRLRARAVSRFEGIVPATIRVALPDGWRAEGATRVDGAVGASVALTLELVAIAQAPGRGTARAALEPYGVRAEAELSLAKPARFDLDVLARELTGAPGAEALVPVEVVNRGEEAGEVSVRLRPAPGTASPAPVTLTLGAGERRALLLPVAVLVGGPESVTLELDLIQAGTTVDGGALTLRRLRPSIALTQRVSLEAEGAAGSAFALLPGDVVTVSLALRNEGAQRAAYTLSARPPEWLEALDGGGTLRYQGVLEPGGTAVHGYRARVAFGPAATGALIAELRYQGIVTLAASALERRLATLRTGAELRAVERSETDVLATVLNPLARPVTLQLRRAAEGASLLGAAEEELVLAPLQELTIALRVRTGEPGSARHTVSLLQDGVPVSASATTALDVLPALTAVRTALVRIPFEVDGADAVLIRHHVPGTVVVAGSSRLADEAVADPLVDDEGRAYWLLDAGAGELRYQALYLAPAGAGDAAPAPATEPAPAPAPADGAAPTAAEPAPAPAPDAVPAPELTAIIGDREVLIAGSARRSDMPARSPADATDRADLATDAADREPPAPDAAGATADRLIVEPADGQRFRGIDPVRIVIRGPANGVLPSVSVNGVELGRDRVGLIQTDATSGTQRVEYYGLSLAPGANVITARATRGDAGETIEVHLAGRPTRLEVVAIEAVANGRSPVRATLVATDEHGAASGFGPVTIVSELEPLERDAFPELSGHQVLLRDGYATVEFRPLVTAREVGLTAHFEALTARAAVLAVPTREALYHFHGSATFGVAQGQSYLAGSVEAYAELPSHRGLWQLALDGRAHATSQGATDTVSRLSPAAPGARFPELGAEGSASMPLASEDGVAVRYTEPGLDVAYAYGARAVPGAGTAGRQTALSVTASVTDVIEVAGFAGLAPSHRIEEAITPDGTRRYVLAHAPRGAGETVLVREQTEAGLVLMETELVRGRDYTIDAALATLTLARPLWPISAGMHDLVLVVRYAPAEAPRDQLAFGAGVRYDDGGFSAELGAARVITEAGPSYRLGAATGYRSEGFGVELRYLRTLPTGERAGDRFAATLYLRDEAWRVHGSATYEDALQASLSLRFAPVEEPWSVRADVATDPLRGVTGDARVAYDLPGGLGTAALEHDRRAGGGAAGRDVTALVYEHHLAPFLVGAGAGYDWQGGGVEALARAAYGDEALSLAVEHRQPLAVDRQARSEVAAGLSLPGGTDLRATVDATWGGDVAGRLALLQPFGPGHASLSYELPTARGEGNRLRFGVETPLELSDALGLDLSAGYLRSFADASTRYSAGAAINYVADGFHATAAGEVAVENGDAKLVARFGAAGSPALDHDLRLAGDFQVLPDLSGSLDLAYAYRGAGLSVLSYHRFVRQDVTSLEGELALAVHPSAAWQLRPSAAYRWLPADPGAGTVQLGVGATAYPVERFGVGANGYYVWQPATGAGALVWGLEGTYRLDATTALALGYGFGSSAGLTPESRGGFYLRFDLFGGNR